MIRGWKVKSTKAVRFILPGCSRRCMGAVPQLRRSADLVSRPTKISRPLHILVVEDNPVNQRLAVLLLKKRGHSVAVANNGKEEPEPEAAGSTP